MGLGAREEGLSRLLAGEWCSRNVKADEQVRTPGALGCPGRAPSTPRPPRAVGTRDGGGLGDAPRRDCSWSCRPFCRGRSLTPGEPAETESCS